MAAPRDGIFAFDLVRAVAALAVLLSHARSLVLLNAPDQPGLSLAGRAVFIVTGLGHQSVILFFVVSGALVTHSLLRLQAEGGSAADFVVKRLCRLLVVLIPCLLLGAAEDRLGLSLAAGDTYGPPRMPASVVADQLTAGVFASNALFLGGLREPTFGSNVPLWTLSFEAWCYAGALAGSTLLRVGRQPIQAACCCFGFGLAAVFLLTPAFWQLAPVWAIGAALAAVLSQKRKFASSREARSGAPTHRRRLAAAVLVVAVLAARGFGEHYQALADYGLAAVAAVALAVLAEYRPRPGWFTGLTSGGAAFSYSLYLSHFPFLALGAAIVVPAGRLPFGPVSLALVATLGIAAIGQAAVVWFVSERHTGTVRDMILRRLRSFALVGTAAREVAP